MSGDGDGDGVSKWMDGIDISLNSGRWTLNFRLKVAGFGILTVRSGWFWRLAGRRKLRLGNEQSGFWSLWFRCFSSPFLLPLWPLDASGT